MAYTSIIPVHRLDNSVDYVLDEKKASRSQNADSLQAAVDYALNKDKTEQDLFCSAMEATQRTKSSDLPWRGQKWPLSCRGWRQRILRCSSMRY